MNAKFFKTVLLELIILAGGFFIASAQNNNSRYIIRTKYFDLIYKTPSKATAELIASNIDDIYLDIRKSFGTEEYYHFKKFPVYIEYSTQELNAYYTDYPFRHVVLYDTVPGDSLLVYENNILSVLQHELVHAVSLNVKNKTNEVLSSIIYDGWLWSNYTAPSSILEGIAVQKESENGEGRLNDAFSTHIVKQAKLENCFPEFQEITGARDIYPSGNIPYIFGGMFTDFVINKYGKEKYKVFISAINDQLKNYWTIYKKSFGTDIQNDYEEFIDSLNIPDIPADPYDNEGITNFYTVTNTPDDRHNKKTSRVTETTSFLTKEKSGTAWYRADSGEVWYSQKLLSRNEDVQADKPVKLFSMTGVSKIVFSSDGRYLAVSRIMAYESYKTIVTVYDMKTGRFYNLNAEGKRDACVLSKNGEYYLAAINTISQTSSLELYRINENGSFTFNKKYDFPFGTVPTDLTDAGNFTLGFIYKDGVNRSISLYYIELDRFSSVALPQGYAVRDLSAVVSNSFVTGQQGLLFAFSYGTKDTFPRLGFLSIKRDGDNLFNPVLHLATADVSGGVYSPSVYFASKSQRLPSVVYSSKFFDHSFLSIMDTDSFEFTQIPVSIRLKVDFSKLKNKTVEEKKDFESKRFSPFEYTLRGIFVPVSLIPFYDEQFNLTNLGIAGVTWHSKGYHLSAGYDPFSMCYGMTCSVFNSSPSENSEFHLSGHVGFDAAGFRQTEDELILKTAIPFGKHSYVFLNSSTRYFYGHPNPGLQNSFRKQSDDRLCTTFVNQDMIEFSTIRKTGAGTNEKGGFYTALFFNYTYLENSDSGSGYGINLGLEAGFKLPQILPFENPKDLTCNLPVTVHANVFTDISRFTSFGAEMILFAMEIQKGTKKFFLPLYMNRFTVTAKYSGSVYYSRLQNMAIANINMLEKLLTGAKYTDYIALGISGGITVNTGSFQKFGEIELGADVIYDIHTRGETLSPVRLKMYSNLVF